MHFLIKRRYWAQINTDHTVLTLLTQLQRDQATSKPTDKLPYIISWKWRLWNNSGENILRDTIKGNREGKRKSGQGKANSLLSEILDVKKHLLPYRCSVKHKADSTEYIMCPFFFFLQANTISLSFNEQNNREKVQQLLILPIIYTSIQINHFRRWVHFPPLFPGVCLFWGVHCFNNPWKT